LRGVTAEMDVAANRVPAFVIIVASFFVALVLSLVSLPEGTPEMLGYLRPHWVALVLVYWVIALPQSVGLATAWCVGILLDILLGTLIGQHAFVLVAVSAIALSLYQRMRMFSVWQQGAIVLAMMLLAEMLMFWIESLAANADFNLWHFLPALVSALIWPWVFLSLRALRRRFGLT